jgi:hypothetical protein
VSAAPAAMVRDNYNNNPNPTPAPAPPPAIAPRELPPVLPAMTNGQGQTHADILIECYREAIRVALKAVDLAREAGLHISPDFEDVRTIATTLCIPKVGR